MSHARNTVSGPTVPREQPAACGYDDDAFPAFCWTSSGPALESTPGSGFMLFPLNSTIQVSWEDESICYFIDQHVLPSSEHSPVLGHLDFIPSLYIGSAADSCIRPAVQAVSYLSLFQFSKSSSLYAKAYVAHLAALRSLNQALRVPESTKQNETLAAVMLLSLFEVRCGLNLSRTLALTYC